MQVQQTRNAYLMKVIKISPNQDLKWIKYCFEILRKEGLLKSLVSKQCTIIYIPGFSNYDNTHFTKSVRNHMILSLTHLTSTVPEIASMNLLVKVEMEDGYALSKKTTTLKGELMNLRLGEKEEGSEGDKYISGAQFVMSGNSKTGGKILVMHSYKLEVIEMMANILSNPVAYIYLYMCKTCHYSEQCARKGISTWLICPNQTADSMLNIKTKVMTTRAQSAHTIFYRDMEKAGCVEIPSHI